MPIIPLLQASPIQPAPDAVLDRERRPTVDNAPLIKSVQRLADSAKRPLLPTEPFTAPAEALAAVGRAIMETGSAVAAVGQKRREAETVVQVSKGESRITEALGKVQHYQAENPDPATWLPHFDRTMGELEQSLAQDKTLNSSAREELSLRLTRLRTNARVETQAVADKALFRQAKGVYTTRMMGAIEDGDQPEYHRAATEAVDRGYLSPEQRYQFDARYSERQAQRQEERIAQQARREHEAVETAAQQAPEAWLTLHGQRWAGKEKLWEFGRRTALEARYRQRVGALETVREEIAAGEIKTSEEVRRKLLPGLTSEAKDELVRHLDRRQQAQQKPLTPQERDEQYLRLWDDIRTYDREQDEKGLHYFQISREIDDRLGPRAGHLREKLRAKSAAEPEQLHGRDEVMQMAMELLDAHFDPNEGRFAWQRVRGTERERLRMESITVRAKVLKKFNDWARSHPKEARDVDQARLGLLQAIPEPYRDTLTQDIVNRLKSPSAASGSSEAGAMSRPRGAEQPRSATGRSSEPSRGSSARKTTITPLPDPPLPVHDPLQPEPENSLLPLPSQSSTTPSR